MTSLYNVVLYDTLEVKHVEKQVDDPSCDFGPCFEQNWLMFSFFLCRTGSKKKKNSLVSATLQVYSSVWVLGMYFFQQSFLFPFFCEKSRGQISKIFILFVIKKKNELLDLCN
jgi:hypothetical protein